jgi:hypothetical protein
MDKNGLRQMLISQHVLREERKIQNTNKSACFLGCAFQKTKCTGTLSQTTATLGSTSEYKICKVLAFDKHGP